MTFDRTIHRRRSIRLHNYDYRQPGAYFVTICTFEKRRIFDDPQLRATAEKVWRDVAASAAGPLDEFVVMPNHVHGIVWITEPTVGAQQPRRRQRIHYAIPVSPSTASLAVAAPLRAPAITRTISPGSLGAIVRAFKSATAKRVNNLRGTPGVPVWQRNYYEHIVRNEAELAQIREYIRNHPRTWHEDPRTR